MVTAAWALVSRSFEVLDGLSLTSSVSHEAAPKLILDKRDGAFEE